MKSPKRSALAYQVEYQFGDGNVLTATFHEELRLRNEARIRNAQPATQRRDICVSDDNPFVNNAKRIQQDQDRQSVVAQHNLILLDRLVEIHTRSVPKQFDVSHLSDEILNAPRASNAQLRRRQQAKIDAENLQMQARLHNTTGTFNTQQLAADAERHRYFSDQISKVGRRRKVKQICQALGEQQRQQNNLRMRLPQDNSLLVGQDRVGERERALMFDQPAFNCYYEAESDAEPCLRGSKSLGRLDQTKKTGFSAPRAQHKDYTMSKLPQLSHHGAHMAPGGVRVGAFPFLLVRLRARRRTAGDTLSSRIQPQQIRLPPSDPGVVVVNRGRFQASTKTSGSKHVPYRDSKLTRLLQDGLGGNTKTKIIATLSPSIDCIHESISTLKFADRAKQVMVLVRMNEQREIDPAYVEKLQDELEQLREVVRLLRSSSSSSSSDNNNNADEHDNDL
ncbi:Kinesin-like protein, partial [Globisporangium splendens]